MYKIIPDYNTKSGKGLNPCIEFDPSKVVTWLEEAEPGEKILIEMIEMELTDYYNLPDYEGP